MLCLSLMVIGLDNTILNVALPSLIKDLDASTSQLQWIIDGYVLVFAGLLLTSGSLGDRFGRRGALTIGLAIFGVGSLVCAPGHVGQRPDLHPGLHGRRRGADHAGHPLAAHQRVHRAQGAGPGHRHLGGGGRGRERARARSSAAFLLQHFWWGSVFLINVPVAILALVLGRLLLPTSKDPSAPRLDPVGAVLSVVGLVALLWGIIEAPSKGWTDPVGRRRLPRRRGRAGPVHRSGSCTPTTRCSTSASSRTPASPWPTRP